MTPLPTISGTYQTRISTTKYQTTLKTYENLPKTSKIPVNSSPTGPENQEYGNFSTCKFPTQANHDLQTLK